MDLIELMALFVYHNDVRSVLSGTKVFLNTKHEEAFPDASLPNEDLDQILSHERFNLSHVEWSGNDLTHADDLRFLALP